MSGLECSEININGLDYSGRMDAEYYQKFYLQLEKQILSNKNDEMGNQANFLIGPFGSSYDTSNYTDVPDYRYVRGQDVKPFVLNDIEPRYMAKNDYERLEKYALEPDDILVSVVGTLGNACIVTKKYLPAIFSCKSSVIRTKTINPYYLVCYLNSKHGHTLLIRNARGAIQQGINLDDLKTLHIPLFTNKFQLACEIVLKLANEILEQSKTEYCKAEKILLSSFALNDFTLSKENTSVKTFSQVTKNERLDAEYYQPKYDDIERKLKQGNYTTAFALRSSNDKNFTPLPKEKYTYIELADIEAHGSITDGCLIADSEELPTRARRKVSAEDVIVSSIEGSLDRCAIIPTQYQGALCSTGFYVMRSEAINPETLLLLFKSYPVRMMMKRGCSGTILTAISTDELKKVPVPIPDIKIQQQVAEKVRQSFTLREKSKALLKSAIRAVEIAIEQDEAAGIKFLQDIK